MTPQCAGEFCSLFEQPLKTQEVTRRIQDETNGWPRLSEETSRKLDVIING